MKYSFLSGAFWSVTRRFGILFLALLLSFGIVISLSSVSYLERFEAMSTVYYADKFQQLQENTESMVDEWHQSQMITSLYQLGDFDSLTSYFDDHFEEFGAVNPKLLITIPGSEPYMYRGRIIPAEVIQWVQDHPDQLDSPHYTWIQNKLWLIYGKDKKDHAIILAIPIIGNQLAFLRTWGYGEYIESVQITQQNIQEDRSLLDWYGLQRSYLIDENSSAYLNVAYQIDVLGEYFYIGYGVVLIISMIGFWILIRYSLKASFHSAIQQMTVFENQVQKIASGDYSKRMERSGFTEFIQLEDEINQMSSAIQSRNDQLNQTVRELYDLLVEVLEQKDPYTRGHSERVATYSMQIARQLGLKNLDEIYSTALLHDIGKIAISENILRKPEKLTALEYDVIKTHPEKGFHLLIKSSQFNDLLNGVLFHHERIDGSGYPYGLKGDQIPLEARIIAVADVYDALTSNRSYRNAMTRSQAITILNNGKEVLYDASVVDCFLQYIEIAS